MYNYKITIDSNNIGMESMKHFPKWNLNKLTTIDLGFNPIKDRGLEYLCLC